MPLSVLNVVGCRPNFIKIAPLMARMRRCSEIHPILLHTGQHYDRAMSGVFFRDLDIPEPDVYLGVGSGTYAQQTAEIVQRLEPVIAKQRPDLVIVVGDVNSTFAAALTAVTLGYPVAHVEAGLRSFDREMPEEINRVLTDAISDLLFATEQDAVDNLLREGKTAGQIHFVGNVMIDSLVDNADRIARSAVLDTLGLKEKSYTLLTLHRPANVDDPARLEQTARAIKALQDDVRVVFPIHPRTAARVEQFGCESSLLTLPNVQVIPPLGYIDFIKLMKESLLVLTDSGGVQEESTALGVPCLTLRDSTERPVTIRCGTNQLVGTAPENVVEKALELLQMRPPTHASPELWDGRAAERIVSVLLNQRDEIKQLYRSVRERTSCLHLLNPASLPQ